MPSALELEMTEHASVEAMAEALSAEIEERLARAIAERGAASLAPVFRRDD